MFKITHGRMVADVFQGSFPGNAKKAQLYDIPFTCHVFLNIFYFFKRWVGTGSSVDAFLDRWVNILLHSRMRGFDVSLSLTYMLKLPEFLFHLLAYHISLR